MGRYIVRTEIINGGPDAGQKNLCGMFPVSEKMVADRDAIYQTMGFVAQHHIDNYRPELGEKGEGLFGKGGLTVPIFVDESRTDRMQFSLADAEDVKAFLSDDEYNSEDLLVQTASDGEGKGSIVRVRAIQAQDASQDQISGTLEAFAGGNMKADEMKGLIHDEGIFGKGGVSVPVLTDGNQTGTMQFSYGSAADIAGLVADAK